MSSIVHRNYTASQVGTDLWQISFSTGHFIRRGIHKIYRGEKVWRIARRFDLEDTNLGGEGAINRA